MRSWKECQSTALLVLAVQGRLDIKMFVMQNDPETVKRTSHKTFVQMCRNSTSDDTWFGSEWQKDEPLKSVIFRIKEENGFSPEFLTRVPSDSVLATKVRIEALASTREIYRCWFQRYSDFDPDPLSLTPFTVHMSENYILRIF